MLYVDVESDDYRFYKTLNEDIQLKPDEYGRWDMQFNKGDLVNVAGCESLKNAICIAIMTRYDELQHNGLYVGFGCRIHELVKSNQSHMVRRKIEYFILEVLQSMRRVKKVNEITVSSNHQNNNWMYHVYFNVTAINDEVVSGGVDL